MDLEPTVYRLDVMVEDVTQDACINSGATFSLMSEIAFDPVQEFCGQLEHPESKLRGAMGKQLNLLGRA